MAGAETAPRRGLLPAVARLVGLDDIPPQLVPLLGVIALGGSAFTAFWAYVAIWAKDVLHASDLALGATFAASAIFAGLVGSAGGALSDRIGRRPVILVGWAGASSAALMGWLAGSNTWLGLGSFVLAGTIGALAQGADQALAADLVPPERREEAFAATRLAMNVGIGVGPVLAAIAFAIGGWDAFFAVAIGLAVLAYLVSLFRLPRSGAYTPDSHERLPFRSILGDSTFIVLWFAGVLQFAVYSASETLLPVSLVDGHGMSPATWGLIAAINPFLVVFLQMRVTRRFGGEAHVMRRLAIATLLMSLPFAVLAFSVSLPLVAVVVVAFVLGEMVFAPTAYAAVERLAPVSLRGAYLGAFTATGAVGFAIAPFMGLQIRERSGDDAMWLAVAGAGVVATGLVVLALRGVSFERRAPMAQPPP